MGRSWRGRGGTYQITKLYQIYEISEGKREGALTRKHEGDEKQEGRKN